MKPLLLTAILLAAVCTAAGTPTIKPKLKKVAADTIPSIAGYELNPYTYRYGTVQEVALTKNSATGKYYTEMYFKPVGTYLFFSEHLIFCGDQRDKLDFKTDDSVVLIHSRLMRQKSCYDLARIDVVEKARTAGTP